MPTLTGKAPPAVTSRVTIVSLRPSCRCRVSTLPTVTGMFSLHLKSASSHGAAKGTATHATLYKLPRSEHLLRSTKNLPLIRLKQFLPEAIALLQFYGSIVSWHYHKGSRTASTTGTTGGRNCQHHWILKNHTGGEGGEPPAPQLHRGGEEYSTHTMGWAEEFQP